jgi:predicted CXXCH cytochrome family protein
LENLRPGVQCEKCHGPGSAHVAAAERQDARALKGAIHRQWSALEEIQLCGKCHRLPEDIAAERLLRYPPSLIRFQPVGLLQSRCYLESGGALRCTTCHPAHTSANRSTPAEQIASCLKCHGEPPQKPCPVSPQTDCIRCHLPAVKLVRDVAFHDHWIRVRRDGAPATEPADAQHAAPLLKDGSDH